MKFHTRGSEIQDSAQPLAKKTASLIKKETKSVLSVCEN